MPKILIVDDEQVNLELVCALIAEEGYETSTALDGEMAYQMVQNEHPDLVMMDVVMPKMNGIETCRKIKTNPMTYSTPVVIITALNSVDDKVKAIKAGANDFITKPFDRLELSARLKSLLRLKAIHDRLEGSLAALKETQQVREALMSRASKDLENPIHAINECLQAIAQEVHVLSPAVAAKLEPALFCVDLVTTMAGDFANIMSMEQDKLKRAYESLQADSQPQVQ
jgi:DNA-binding response OmpR family regulator